MFALTKSDVVFIVEEFLAEHFHFDHVSLNRDSVIKIEELIKEYGKEIDFIKSNSVRDAI